MSTQGQRGQTDCHISRVAQPITKRKGSGLPMHPVLEVINTLYFLGEEKIAKGRAPTQAGLTPSGVLFCSGYSQRTLERVGGLIMQPWQSSNPQLLSVSKSSDYRPVPKSLDSAF